jgi:hypothetical protein
LALLALLAVTTATLLGIATPTTAPPLDALELLVDELEQAASRSVTTPSTALNQIDLIIYCASLSVVRGRAASLIGVVAVRAQSAVFRDPQDGGHERSLN